MRSVAVFPKAEKLFLVALVDLPYTCLIDMHAEVGELQAE